MDTRDAIKASCPAPDSVISQMFMGTEIPALHLLGCCSSEFQEEFLYQVMANHGIKDGFGRSLQRGLGRSTNTVLHPSFIIRQDKPLWMLGITQITFSAMSPPLGPSSCEEQHSPLQSCPSASSHAPFMVFWWVKPCPALVLFICIFMPCLSQKSSHTDHLLCVHTLLWAFHAHRSNFAERGSGTHLS